MRKVSIKVVEKIKIHILCSVTLFENRAVYEVMWKNMVESESADDSMAACCMLDQ